VSPGARGLDEAAAAFGCTGRGRPLAGGARTSVRYGDAVLKPCLGEDEAEFVQTTLARIAPGPPDLQVPGPRRAGNGRFVVAGWTATEYVPGLRELRPDWRAVVAAGARFHALVRDVAPDASLVRRTHRWAVADRVAWDEAASPLLGDAAAIDASVRRWCAPVTERAQVIHGDLTGNVLTTADRVPVLLDFSPYVRPPRYASAIVVADALLWHRAPVEVVSLLGDDPFPLLGRALRFRLVAEQLADAPRHGADLAPFRALLDRLG
jgi:hypothetical protein